MRCEWDHLIWAIDPGKKQADLALEQHLSECPSCRQEWESLQRAVTLLGQAGNATPPLAFGATVMARIAAESQAAAVSRASAINYAVLASVLTLAGGFIVGLAAASYVLVDVVSSPEAVVMGVLVSAASCANALMTLLAVVRALLVAARNFPLEATSAAFVCLLVMVGGSIAVWASRSFPGPARPGGRP